MLHGHPLREPFIVTVVPRGKEDSIFVSELSHPLCAQKAGRWAAAPH